MRFCFLFFCRLPLLCDTEFVQRLLCCWIEHHVYEIYCRKGKGKLRIFLKVFFYLEYVPRPQEGVVVPKYYIFGVFNFMYQHQRLKRHNYKLFTKFGLLIKKKGLSDQVE